MAVTGKALGDATLAIHAGEGVRVVGSPVTPSPSVSTSFFTHPDAIGFSANDLSDDAPHFYSRWSNPTLDILEGKLAALEGGEAAVSFASGMAAISALFLGVLRSGDHLVISDVCYAGVAELVQEAFPRFGIEFTAVDTSDLDEVAAAMRPSTRLVHVETPANPILRITDIGAVAAIAHASGAELSVDSTIATPVGTKPIAFGADYVVHSLTKYAGGHGDALGGVVVGRAGPLAELRKRSLIHFGGVLAPAAAWLILRGLETLGPRMLFHEANARRIERFLAGHRKVRSVLWPGSSLHPQHDLAARQMKNFSGLLSFSVKAGSMDMARRLAERLEVFSFAVSLGKTRSLLFYIPTEDILRSSLRLEGAQAARYREWAGEGVFRVSVGLEDADDLVADLEQALGDG